MHGIKGILPPSWPHAATDRARGVLDAEWERLALWLPVCVGAGVLLYFALRQEPWPWAGPLVTGLAATALASGYRAALPRILLAPVVAAALGFTAGQLATARAPPLISVPAHAVIASGRVVATETLPEARRITLAAVRLGADGPVLARTIRIRLKPADATALAPGDIVRVRAMLRPVGPPVLPGGWDMQRDAFFSGLGASGYALGPVETVARADPRGLAGVVNRIGEAIAARITAALPGTPGQVAAGILIGRPSGIPAADIAAFRDSGLAHLLAVSGLHLGIVIGVTMAAVRTLLALSEHAALHWPIRAIASLVALGVGGVYTLLTRAQVPTLRCFLMACLITLALLAGRRPISLHSLGLAAAAIMLVSPQELVGASMQMSFAAVLALIAGHEALRPRLLRAAGTGPGRWLLTAALGLLASSLLAGSATLPFAAYHFGRVQLYYVLPNLIAVPLTAILVMPAGMLALPLMLFDLEWLALIPVGWGIEATLWIARTVAAWPAAALPVPPLPSWGLLLITFGMLWAALWRTKLRWGGVPIMLAGVLSPLAAPAPDILVSHDARLIALRLGDTIHVQQMGGSAGFVRDAWMHHWGVADGARLPAMGDAGAGAIRCGPAGCLLRPYPGRPAAWLARTAERPQDCHDIAVIVSSEPARGLCPRPFPALVDRFTVWRDGPAAIWLRPSGAIVLTDRMWRGDRPWVPPPPTPRVRPPPRLPLAPTEGGPGTERRESWRAAPVAE